MPNLTPQQLAELEAKIREAVPESEHRWNDPHEDVSLAQQFDSESGTLKRPLDLQDVLIAANEAKKYLWVNQDMGHLYVGMPPMPTDVFYDLNHDCHWNIEHNPEFASLLYQLLL